MNFTVTDNTTLDDLLALQLHLLEDEVGNIVDKAVKEMAIEKVLLQLLLDYVQAHRHQEHFIHNMIKHALSKLIIILLPILLHFWAKYEQCAQLTNRTRSRIFFPSNV